MANVRKLYEIRDDEDDESFLSDEEREDLMLIVNDKSHGARDKENRTIPGLEKAFQLFPETSKKELFRGLPKRWKSLNPHKSEILIFPFYTSFSERKEVALDFASESKVILHLLPRATGFNYCQWQIEEYEQMRDSSLKDFKSCDGEYMIEGAEEEAEWIFPRNSRFQVVDNINENGIKIITIRQL